MYYLSGIDDFVGLGATTRPARSRVRRGGHAADRATALDIAQTNVHDTSAALKQIDAELAQNPHDQFKRAMRAQYKTYLNQQSAQVAAAKGPSFFSGFADLGAAAAGVPRLNRPAYPFKGYACKAGGGVRQNQLKAEAYCAATQAMQAVVSSCSPFSWYCDPTRPVRKRAGNPKAPAGQTAPPGGAIAMAQTPMPFAPCPDGYSMPNPVTGQCPGVQQPSPFGVPNWVGGPLPGAPGACPPGAMFNQATNSCVSAISGQPIVGPSYYQPPAYPSPYPSYPYGGGMPAAPAGYGGPLLTPIDSGGGDMSEGGTPIYSGGAPAAMSMGPMQSGPLLTPIDEAGYPDMTGGGPGMQFTDQAAFNQAAGGMPSPTSAQGNPACQQEVVSQPGSDQFGPLQIVQIVCAPAASTGAPAGSPMPGVYSPDEIAQQEIATLTGLGRYIG